MAPKVFFTLNQKIRLIDEYENSNLSKAAFARIRGIPVSTLKTIIASKDRLESSPLVQYGNKRKKLHTSSSLDKAVLKWLRCDESNSVTRQILKDTALRIAREQKIMNFSASGGWLEKFKRRYGIALKATRKKAGANSSSEQKKEDPNLLPTGNEEMITPDVEMQCSDSNEMESQCIASTSLSNNSDIVVKQEIIETEVEPSTFEDSSLHSSFADGPSEAQFDGQGPSTSYVAHSDSSNSNTDIPTGGEARVITEEPPQLQVLDTVKEESVVSSNSCNLISEKNCAISYLPPILNVQDPESSMRDEPIQSKAPPTDINVSRSECSPIIEQIQQLVSSHVGTSFLPQDLISSLDKRPCNNEFTQPEVPSHSNPPFRPRDRFDVFGEFIASKLRNLDPKSSAFVQTTFADLISKAELGMFSNGYDRSISATESEDIGKSTQNTFGSENTHGSSGKENIQPGIPSHLPSDFSTLGHVSSTRDGSIQHRVPSHIANSPFPPAVNNTISEPTQPRVTSHIENSWPPGLNVSIHASTPTYSPTPTRITSHTVQPSVPPILNTSNSWSNMPIQPRVPFHMRPRDDFDIYGDFVASKLRNLDTRSRTFVQTAFADIIFKAELGRFVSEGEQNLLANKTNDVFRNMPFTYVPSSQKNVSHLSSYEAQRRFSSTSSNFCAGVPLEIIPNMHSVHK